MRKTRLKFQGTPDDNFNKANKRRNPGQLVDFHDGERSRMGFGA
jgi:hypothetical protein